VFGKAHVRRSRDSRSLRLNDVLAHNSLNDVFALVTLPANNPDNIH